MKKWLIILGVIVILALVFALTKRVDNSLSDEDDLTEGERITRLALELYEQKKQEGMEFSSQCLGTVDGYAVDIVHVPRTEEDNLPENQCEDFREGRVSKFIELDKDGNVVRIFNGGK